MQTIRIAPIVILLLVLTGPFQTAADLPSRETLHQWIEAMKTSPKGPFTRIRWFCKDGSVLPPKPYACKDHGGGVQHGEWTGRVKQLRADGNPIEADIEFGFINSKLQLFQIRPFLESIQARSNEYLTNLDKDMSSQLNQTVKLDEQP
jgi:hypothetical protein